MLWVCEKQVVKGRPDAGHDRPIAQEIRPDVATTITTSSLMAWSSLAVLCCSRPLRPSFRGYGQYEEDRSPTTATRQLSKPRRRHSLGAGTENEAAYEVRSWPTG